MCPNNYVWDVLYPPITGEHYPFIKLLEQGHGDLFSNTRALLARQGKKVQSKAVGWLLCVTQRPHQGGGSTAAPPAASLIADLQFRR
jgi:hypothetical protein